MRTWVIGLLAVMVLVVATSCLGPVPEREIPMSRRVPDKLVIAHRGSPYWAPEETRPAFELARELGADYLEADLQRTKDGVLICLHDDDLRRTTDIEERFPGRQDQPASAFTWNELRILDAGSWFNAAYPERARESYRGLRIVTLEELLDIAEAGAASGAGVPGVYLETKRPELYPGIEKDLAELLERRGWLSEEWAEELGKAPVVVQTFDRTSLELLGRHLPGVPRTLLLWHGEGHIETIDRVTVEGWLDFAVSRGASFVGVSFPGELENAGYGDLLQEWIVSAARVRGLGIHGYTFKTAGEIERHAGRCDGWFTDRTDLMRAHRGEPGIPAVEAIGALGY